jgi:hypothetical protein
MTAVGVPLRKRVFLIGLAIVALIATVHWSGLAQQQKMVHGVFAGFEPKQGQEQTLLTALQSAQGQLTGAPGVLLTSVYERVGTDNANGVTKYLFITTFENMSYVKSATKNQQLLSVMAGLNNLSQYSRVSIINLKGGKVADANLQ